MTSTRKGLWVTFINSDLALTSILRWFEVLEADLHAEIAYIPLGRNKGCPFDATMHVFLLGRRQWHRYMGSETFGLALRMWYKSAVKELRLAAA